MCDLVCTSGGKSLAKCGNDRRADSLDVATMSADSLDVVPIDRYYPTINPINPFESLWLATAMELFSAPTRTAVLCIRAASLRIKSTIDTMGRAKSKSTTTVNKIGFRANSKEGKFLAKLLQTGKVSAGITPGALKELYPQFKKFKNDSFAAGLRRMKTKYGCNVRGGTGKSIDQSMPAIRLLPLLTPFYFSPLDDEEEEELDDDVDVLEVDDDDDEGMEEVDRKSTVLVPTAQPVVSVVAPPPAFASSGGGWNPDYIKGRYQDAVTMGWHQVLLIVLPTGVGATASTEDVDLRTEYNNTVLAVQHLFPQWISNWQFFSLLKQALLEQAKLQWQSLLPANQEEAKEKFQESFALMAHALRAQMTTMRADPEVPTIKATARIKLDFAVKPITSADWLFIGNEDGVRMLFVDLKAPTETSYEAKPVKELLLPTKEKK